MRLFLRRLPERLTWGIMVWFLHRWASRYMDQFESFAIDTEFGLVHVSVARKAPGPGVVYELLNNFGKSQGLRRTVIDI